MTRCALFTLVSCLALGCVATDSTSSHFAKEFDWAKKQWVTPVHRIPVAPPKWLAEKDVPQLLAWVDRCATNMTRTYTWAEKNFDFSRTVVWIHESPMAFVGGTPNHYDWLLGWSVGKYVLVCWNLKRDDCGRPIGLEERDLFVALTHEWMHQILHARYGYGDPGHNIYFPMEEVRMAMWLPRVFATSITLSKESIEAGLNYKYMPWIVPGGW